MRGKAERSIRRMKTEIEEWGSKGKLAGSNSSALQGFYLCINPVVHCLHDA